MQLRHAVGARALEAHHGDHVAIQFPRLERCREIGLAFEHGGGRIDHASIHRHGRHLDDAPPKIAGQKTDAAFGLEWRRHRTQDIFVQRLVRAIAPRDAVAIKPRLLCVGCKPFARHGLDVSMQQACGQKLARDEGHAACCMELVHIRRPVRIDAREERHDRGDVREVVPVHDQPRRQRHRRYMQRMVGRAACRHQSNDGVDDGACVYNVRHRAFARLCKLDATRRRRADERLPQRCVGIHERRAGQVKTHQLHHHLVGVGGPIEGAGSGGVITRRLRLQKLLPRNLSKRELLADLRLLLVADARRHRPRRREDDRQVPEAQRADHQPRHDLVARSQHQPGVERIMRQRHGRGERNHIAREQRQLHPWPSLRDAIAHRRHAARHLRRRACFPGRILDDVGIVLERLVRAQHVVVAGDNADIRRAPAQAQLVAQRNRRKRMREVPARQMLASRPGILRGLDAREIIGAALLAPLLDAGRHFGDLGVHGHGAPHHSSCRVIWPESRSRHQPIEDH